ncbi:MAG TPA: diguanylate cyclase [Candidatus Angelobacter sp.]|nr:diguanylate cyclase [Candidatus Angelobacter sp.]
MNILLVEDSRIDTHQISSYLDEWGFEFRAVADGLKAWNLLQEAGAPQLILLDWMLPGIDGVELCRRIRTLSTGGTYFYTVMLTAKDKKQDLLTAMAAGADDYLAKPVDPSELKARVLVGRRILELQQSLRFAATHDFLTRLLNRAEILAGLKRELARSERTGHPVAVIMGDLDHFKQINDSHGHPAGDEVLKDVALRLRTDLRPYDLAGRYGGEEFLLILPTCNLAIATRRAEQLRLSIAQNPIQTPFGALPVTLSMGVTVSSPEAEFSVEELLQQADHALYQAKEKGRNCVQTFAAERPALPGFSAKPSLRRRSSPPALAALIEPDAAQGKSEDARQEAAYDRNKSSEKDEHRSR